MGKDVRWVICPTCGGTGELTKKGQVKICPQCRGRGQIQESDWETGDTTR